MEGLDLASILLSVPPVIVRGDPAVPAVTGVTAGMRAGRGGGGEQCRSGGRYGGFW